MMTARRIATLAIASLVLEGAAGSAVTHAAPPSAPSVSSHYTNAQAARPTAQHASHRAASRGRTWVTVFSQTQPARSRGATYQAALSMSSPRKKARAVVTLRQVVNRRVVAARSTPVQVRRGVWRPVRLTLRTTSTLGIVQVLVKSASRRRTPLRMRGVQVKTLGRPAPANVPAKPGVPTTQSPTTPPGQDPAGWNLDMTEDFDVLGSHRWNVKNNTYATNESSYLLARNATTTGGALNIQGKLESAGGRNYTSARVDTNGKYSLPNYFRTEVRAKVPFQQGLWSAPLWFRPSNGGFGEIDLVETYGSERRSPKVHQTIHNAYGSGHQVVHVSTPFSAITSTPAGSWHTYTIEKTPGHIRMWVDGHQTADFTKSSAPWFNQYYEAGLRWNLRANMQIGGTYGLPDSTTNWASNSSAMQLDYVKTWILK